VTTTDREATPMTELDTIRWDHGDDGVVVLTMDDPSQSANTATDAFAASLTAVVDRLAAERETVTGVVLTSAKKTFFAGGDLELMMTYGPEDRVAVFEKTEALKAPLRRLETLGVPVVAAINGAALGGGLELALATHHRIAANLPGCTVGLPEVTWGLLAGGGGVTRTVRLLGVQAALQQLLLTGQTFAPAQAVELGLVDELVGSVEELLPAAKAWIQAHPEAGQPWDQPGYLMPGGHPTSPQLARVVPFLPAATRKESRGANLPAPRAIVAAAVEGAYVDVDTALTIETRYFTELVTGQVSKNIVQSRFFDLRHITSGGTRPAGVPAYRPQRVAVLGAGMMGAGIAHVLASAGVDVVLKDVTAEAAEKGRAHSAALLARQVERGRLDPSTAERVKAQITATADVAQLAGCDAVIEAVFENPELKASVFTAAEPHLAKGALLASNTSTLPITSLAQAVSRPDNFIGMHFFSPVDRMPLVEIIVGEQTGDEALARAIDMAQLLRKTPIVVNDSRGFFTSRTIGVRLVEAVDMVAEGISPASIEQAGLQAGYPSGPLQLFDEVTLTLSVSAWDADRAADPGGWVELPGHGVVRTLAGLGRGGRAAGAGFYEYAEGRRTGLWPGLSTALDLPEVPGRPTVPWEDLKDRLLFSEALEAVHCFDQGVLRSVEEANIGSLFGIGFPGWTGGVIQLIDGYKGPAGAGVTGFVGRAEELAGRYGDRFRPPASLVEIAKNGGTARDGLGTTSGRHREDD
jgi:3-hydroxyacyl-CoA dehydrogenase/enoyl-CoA hydratase/3-hydroxybutyryl-CoA epimerase